MGVCTICLGFGIHPPPPSLFFSLAGLLRAFLVQACECATNNTKTHEHGTRISCAPKRKQHKRKRTFCEQYRAKAKRKTAHNYNIFTLLLSHFHPIMLLYYYILSFFFLSSCLII